MSEPWEDFGPQKETGPWDEFSSEIRNTKKTALKEAPQFQPEKLSFFEKAAPYLYGMVEPLTPHGMLSQPTRALGMPDPQTDTPLLKNPFGAFLDPNEGMPRPMYRSPEKAAQIAESVRPLIRSDAPSQFDKTILGGIVKSIDQGISGMTSPEALLTLPALANPVGRAAIAGQMAYHAPEAVAQQATEAGSAQNKGELAKALMDIVQTVGMPAAVAAIRPPAPVPTGATPAFPPINYLNELESRRFLPTATPAGPRTSMESVPLINQPPALPKDIILPGERPEVPPGIVPVERGTVKQEPLGGQVSFQSPAEAGAVPSARQTATEELHAGVTPPSLKEIGEKLGYIVKTWDSQYPVIGGTSSFTDPKTGFTVEGFKADATPETVQARMQQKLQEAEKLRDPQALNEITPAIRLGNGRLLIGKQGETHADVLIRNGQRPEMYPHESPNRGFYDSKTQKFLSRREAEEVTGKQGTAAAGGMDSMDLPGAAERKLYDQESQGRIQGGEREGQEPGRAVSEPGEGGGQTTSGGVLQKERQQELIPSKQIEYSSHFAKMRAAAEGNQKIARISDAASRRADLESLWAGAKPSEEQSRLLLTGPRIARTPSEIGFTDTSKEVDAVQLRNRLRNKLTPSEWSYYDDVLPKEGKISPEKAAELMEERGPKVEVRVFRSGGEELGASRRTAEIEHQLETLGYGRPHDGFINTPEGHLQRIGEVPENIQQLAREHESLGGIEGRIFDPDIYRQIAPKDKDQTVVMVRVPSQTIDRQSQSVLHRGHHFGPEDVNNLGWARIQYEEVGGEKVAHVIEVQSDWAQKERDRMQEKRSSTGQRIYGDPNKPLQHPLLKDHQRLVLKAAIDQAIKDGADRIAISDAETAMMSEMHDQATAGEIPQEVGMRLNYDKILPRVMEELTGEKGKKVSFGEHQNAFEEGRLTEAEYEGDKTPRHDLRWKDEFGEPKTDATGLVYDLKKIKGEVTERPYSMFDKDRPGSRVDYMYAGVPIKPREILDALFGLGQKRPLGESLDHLRYKWSGVDGPRHTAFSKELGNRLVEFAASGTAVVKELKSLGIEFDPAIANSIKKDTLRSLIDQGIKDGVYSWDSKAIPGAEPKDIREQGGKTLWIRQDLFPEFKQAYEEPWRPKSAGAQFVMEAATWLQIRGYTDFVFHTRNMYASIVGSPGKVPNYVLDQVMRQFGVKQVDAVARLSFEFVRALKEDPQILAHEAEIARIGASRGEERAYSTISNKLIQLIDRAGRVARDKMYDNLVKQGYPDTELNRRTFINKMGQYEARLMSYWQSVLRNITSAFVVAGRTFYRGAAQKLTLASELPEVGGAANYTKMKVSNLINLVGTLIAVPVAANMILSGKPFPTGVPVGMIGTGKKDKDGRQIVLDPGATDLVSRGMQQFGIRGLVESLRAGKTPTEAGAKAGVDILEGLAHPWMGPPVRAGVEGIVAKAQGDKPAKVLQRGLEAVNPNVAEVVKAGVHKVMRDEDQETTPGERVKGVVENLASAFGYKKGRSLTHEERVKEVAEKKGFDLGNYKQRVAAEKEYKKSAPPLTEEQKLKSAQKAMQRESERRQNVISQLTKEEKGFVKAHGVVIPSYGNLLSESKVKVHLSEEENKRLDQLVLEGYQAVIAHARNDPGFMRREDSYIQRTMHRRFVEANAKARDQLERELKKGKAAKKFSVFEP